MSKKVSFMQEVKNIIKENEVKQVQFGNLQFHVKQYIPLRKINHSKFSSPRFV